MSYLWKTLFQENSGQVDAALKPIAAYEKYAVKRTPLNKVIQSTFSRKANLQQDTGNTENIEQLISELGKYYSDDLQKYRCNLAIREIQEGYASAVDIDQIIIPCKNTFENITEGYGTYIDIILAFKNNDYQNCIKLLSDDDSKVEKLFDNKVFLSKIYAEAGEFKKAKDLVSG